ncbi:MAG: MarR family transcriptional regulator [Woeseiaceae bacterium]|nr:MarR family transcriptional regulator [Woeseiaceae bacterium]
MARNQALADAADDILEQWSGERPELDTASLGIVIRVLALAREYQRDAALALADLDLELFEYDALSALRRQGKPFALPATTLARETDLSSGAMTNRIDRLEARKLVTRVQDPQDRRTVVVRLTAAGKRLIDRAVGLRLDVADRSMRELDTAQRRQLEDLLRRLCA